MPNNLFFSNQEILIGRRDIPNVKIVNKKNY
jgi:hypothetical protein